VSLSEELVASVLTKGERLMELSGELNWIQANDPTRQAKFWQRNYYEHIIRNERELQAIRLYIRLNPENWVLDRDNPDNICRLSPPKTVEDYLREALMGGGSSSNNGG